MSEQPATLRDFIYLDYERVSSAAAQLDLSGAPAASADRPAREALLLRLEAHLLQRGGVLLLDAVFDSDRWNTLADGQFVLANGVVRLLDFSWLSLALSGLPAVLRKMSKIELAALRNSDEGKRMSKSQFQQRSLENQSAIAKVEEFKIDELSGVVRQLYGDVVRVKVRPDKDRPQHVLVASAYTANFYDSPAALSQKYGVDIDAGWRVLGQVNAPNVTNPPQPIPVGNQMEDAFEQIALLMNNAFRVANAPAKPALSLTPIAIYRVVP